MHTCSYEGLTCAPVISVGNKSDLGTPPILQEAEDQVVNIDTINLNSFKINACSLPRKHNLVRA